MLPGLVTALVLMGQRYSLESRNKAVELALDYAELQNLAVSSGATMPELLDKFKSVGVTSVAVSEQLLGDLVATGQVSYQERSSQTGPLTVVRVTDRALAERILRTLSVRLDRGMVSPDPTTLNGKVPSAFVVRAAPATLNGMGIGLPPDAVGLVKRSGLGVVARLQNHPAMTSEAIAAAMSDMRRDGIKTLICAGEEVLGFRGLIENAAEQMMSSGVYYGSVEFAKQRGDSGMCRHLRGQFIRVHSIPSAEMAGMAPSTAIERFARSVKERNIRLCYVRLFESTGDDPIAANAAFVLGIRREITGAGYTMGAAHPFDDTRQAPALLIPIALSAAAGAVLLVSSLVTVSAAVQFGLLLAAFVALAGLTVMGKHNAAFIIALIFPTLGVIRVFGPYLGREITGSFKHPALRSSSRFVRASIYTLTGAILIAGMLGTRPYMIKTQQFVGIKAAHLLPLLVVIFVMAAGLPMMNQPMSAVWKKLRANLKEVVSSPLFIWQALGLMFAVGIIGFALLRTGNDPGIGVSGLELKTRAVLDKVMLVRPRTKEFLIGHPALIVGAAFLFARRRAIGLPLVALGVLGQVSLLNTFCHIHTPLALTLLRAFNGLLLGLVIGLAVWWFIGRPIVSATAPSALETDEE